MATPSPGSLPRGRRQVHPPQRWRLLAAILLSGLLAAETAVAAGPGSSSVTEAAGALPSGPTMPSAASLQEEVARKKEDLKADFDALRHKLEAAAESQGYADRDALLQEVDSLRQLERVYGQESALAGLQAETADAQARLEEDLRRLREGGAAGERPFSFRLLDRLQDDLDAETARLETLDASVEFAGEALQQARQTLDAAERSRRAAQEQLDTNRDPARTAEREMQVRLAKLASQVAGEEARLRELELAHEKLDRDVRRLHVTYLSEQVGLIAREVKLTDSELREQVGRLVSEEFSITRVLDETRREMMVPGAMAAGRDGVDRERRQTLQLRFAAQSQRLQQLADLKLLWSRRFALASGTFNRDELPEWERDVRRQIERADAEERLYTARLVELRRSPTAGREDTATPAPREQGEVDESARVYETALANLAGYRRAQERLLQQIEAVTQHEPLSDRLRQGWRMAQTAWGYEIVAVEDRPITVGKIVLGILLFVAGLYVASFLSRFFGRRIFPRLGLDPGASAALQSLSYYILVVALTLSALQVVNVPLTLFTFVGGALAIGVGFGSQNIVNNFISGLILLAERPIKVGDLVELGDMHGTVEGIGARSTRVRSYKNIHVIVPNSHFLEKEVVNWTLTDDSVKTGVTVGVAYGSPTDRVRDLLVEAVSHHEKIFTAPAPTVLFRDFGESALDFEVYFWIRIRSTMEKLIIESDVRYRIDELFRKAGIVIAFPQRDLHFDAGLPLEVRLRRE